MLTPVPKTAAVKAAAGSRPARTPERSPDTMIGSAAPSVIAAMDDGMA